MKESQDFVVQKLKQLFIDIKGVKIRYEYRDFLGAHLIEVLPIETFENDHEYLLREIAIQDEFENMYGEFEEILFISSESLNEITEAQFSLGYDIQEKFEVSTLFLHSFKTIGFDLVVNQQDSSYALAA